jgi:eukaryotic-like serine/threonine-protein kinase
MQDVNLVLADRYQARERLGSGAGAGVEEYLGRDLRLARPVVIQVIRGAGKDGFAPQARLMASLDHPAVASVYDWGQQEGLAYLIREYVPGQNLGRLLMERGVMPVAQAAGIGAEVAAALAAAHRIGLAHGSLDAADVILGDQRVTVVGFGAAWMRKAAATAAEEPGVALQEPGAAVHAPGARSGAAGEQPGPAGQGPGASAVRGLRGGPGAPAGPDAQGDLRALGGMLYQMVTGAPPERWPAVTRMAGAGLSFPLRQVIDRLMASEPGDRYRAAEAVRADLLHITLGQSAPAQPAPPAQARRGSPVATDPSATTAPVRVPADAPPSWVSTSEAPPAAIPGSAARPGPPGGDTLDGQDGTGRRRRRRASVWTGLILGLALLGGAVAGALLLTRDPGQRATVQPPSSPAPASVTTVQATDLPDVVGLDERAAASRLERAGLVANISRRPSEQAPGVVTSQSPGAGQRPPRGAIVFLTVSSGPGDSTVPSGPGVPPPTSSPEAPLAPPTTAVRASP